MWAMRDYYPSFCCGYYWMWWAHYINICLWNGLHLSGLGDKCLPELKGSSLTFTVNLGQVAHTNLNIMYRHVVLRLRDALCPVTLVIAIQCVLMYQERET